eukprot:5290333-Amphidinium_carterae.2
MQTDVGGCPEGVTVTATPSIGSVPGKCNSPRRADNQRDHQPPKARRFTVKCFTLVTQEDLVENAEE